MKPKVLLLLSLAFSFSPALSQADTLQRESCYVDLIEGTGYGHLAITAYGTCITVQVRVEDRLQLPLDVVDTRGLPDLAKLGLQVWLLKADGTVVPQRSGGDHLNMSGSIGVENWHTTFDFAKMPPAEIVGIVFQREGKLYSQAIKVTDWRTP